VLLLKLGGGAGGAQDAAVDGADGGGGRDGFVKDCLGEEGKRLCQHLVPYVRKRN
jgi:hypothetical protein